MDVVSSNLDYLLDGAKATVVLSVCAVILAVGLGAAAGVVRLYGPRWMRLVSALYIGLFRGTPVLVQMFFIFFGLPALAIRIPTFPAAVLAMSLWMAVNTAEVVRGGIQSIPRGQFEAARSIGLSEIQAMRYVIFPQAVRRMIPPFVGLCTILIKDTSLAAIIGVFELTRAAQETIERTFQSFEIYLTAAAIYFVICFPLTRFAQRAEARLLRP